MRLTKEQINHLILATHKFFGESAQIWLFGSRADDNKKGGDIDLYIETDKNQELIAAKLEMLGFIWFVFGDQKIDLLIPSRTQAPSPMHTIAKSSGIELLPL